MNGQNHHDRAMAFLRVAPLFQLGNLPTELPHPETRELSSWARNDLPRAVSVLKGIDLHALNLMEGYAPEIDRLARRVEETLAGGNRVFLCGCGATGRLSLSLEYLWRQRRDSSDEVVSFMAGGDVALVHSLEGFEDYPAHGARHLEEMGFSDGDLLISCTEGGETPYVIGATEKAAEISSNRPFFLYCNATSALADQVERFQRVHLNPRIEKICLHVGPMALAGSTRMQASTALQLAVGAALLHPGEPARELISDFRGRLRRTDLSFLPAFIERESDLYRNGVRVNYLVRDYAITVFTDTTERAPTFGLAPFRQNGDCDGDPSLCHVSLEEACGPAEAWVRLLNRWPRPLAWPEVDPRTTSEYLRGFDFSARAVDRDRGGPSGSTYRDFRIRRSGEAIDLRLDGLAHQVPVDGLPELLQHLLLKQILNIHSTLVMGRLGRYERNLMTWVVPTNGKLVDRATRYVSHLLAGDGRTEQRYEDIVRELFAEADRTPPGESVVLRTYRSLLQKGTTH
jgi:N-acetylmuramic acid 6-phosphate etherase